ncbi:hypothetical protein R1sor_017490 [Riccia sorocarpa]|uniref:Amino acid transporter transmembrane domain-containing protein n=1 Tax=Riccia sorocarpa TaxID=122646 RepID=A0ABD3I708_9MARC
MEAAESDELPLDRGALSYRGPRDEESRKRDAGALVVLESKGGWVHAGYHLSTSIAAPPLITLPYAFTLLGWGCGTVMLILGAVVTFYAYNLLAVVIEEIDARGRRHLRFRDVGEDIIGPWFGRGVVYPLQAIVCLGANIGYTLLGGTSMKIIYRLYSPDGNLKLYHFIIFFAIAMILVAQLPSFHSLRYVNFLSLILTLAYSFLIAGASIYLGYSNKAPPRDYSLKGSQADKIFGAFLSLSIIATIYGNGIIPEIQGTLAPPVVGKMFKGLTVAYAVVFSTYFTVAFSGYWAFGNLATPNIFSSFLEKDGTSLVPNWLIVVPNILVILQLIAAAAVYCQPIFDLLEAKTADAEQHRFAPRNLIARLISRTSFLILTTLVAAVLPFFGDLVAAIGAVAFTPLDFIFPMLFYILVFKPPKRSIKFWGNLIIVVAYSLVAVAGIVSSIRQLVVDSTSQAPWDI